MTYAQIREVMEAFKCRRCYGFGTVDDAEPGDIYYKQYECSRCHGTGFEDSKHRVLVIGGHEHAEGL